ncbi:MAG: endonuclease/exonuclease/phosphatase family protein, partial [Planctomycetota bacterium]
MICPPAADHATLEHHAIDVRPLRSFILLTNAPPTMQAKQHPRRFLIAGSYGIIDSRWMLTLCFLTALVCWLPSADADTPITVATYNASLYGKAAGETADKLRGGEDKRGIAAAGIAQTVRPDVLLVNEIDYDSQWTAPRLLATKYFSVGQKSASGETMQPIEYPFVYSAAVNTGVASGLDINGDGDTVDPEDAFGYGRYPGQYGMAVFSRHPIDVESVRTFQEMLWKDFPQALKPVDPQTGKPFYSDKVWDGLRLSSKSHWDVPIRISATTHSSHGNTETPAASSGWTLHLLCSHPTPPAFDGPVDRNGALNHDEIDFWNHYLGDADAASILDDAGTKGGLAPKSHFVVVGDLNSDPMRGASRAGAIRRLLNHP